MDEFVALEIHLIESLPVSLGQDEVTRLTIASLDGFLAIGRDMFAVMTPKTSVPVFMSDKVGM